ncbi:Ppx/GppA phosphatase family protein [Oceanibaculum pacificum]|uniref:Ppx/GppA phosphatase family protein n=1 Tax=Oceanibaculum pacificum TaxID=580166 RepID=UPI00083685D2|nr:Ppx/GppA phosphatase family protein [Oceanibaculum pacificum]
MSISKPYGAKDERGGAVGLAAPLPSAAASSGAPVLAALDLGTNNCRLLIAKPARRDHACEGFRVIDAFSRIVRLGEGICHSGLLSQAAMDRTVDALRICADKMRRRNVSLSRVVATEACRRATNCEGFLQRVKRETGLDIEIISTEEEAALAVAGCVPLLDRRTPYGLVFDIGGGSTEVSFFRLEGERDYELRKIVSIPLGVVTLAEQFGGKHVGPAIYEAMVTEVSPHLEKFEAICSIGKRIQAGEVQMLGTSGTVTTLAGMHLGLPRYDRSKVDGTFLGFDQVNAMTRRLVDLDYAGRAAQPCIGQDRADLVLAGCAILDAICRRWPVGRLRVGDRGVREGILFGLLARHEATRRRDHQAYRRIAL